MTGNMTVSATSCGVLKNLRRLRPASRPVSVRVFMSPS